jgi:hypothetical protein
MPEEQEETTTDLHILHEKIREGIKREDEDPHRKDRLISRSSPPLNGETYSGYREFSDFRKEANRIEGIFKERGEPYEPIKW